MGMTECAWVTWPRIEMKMAGWKSERSGRTGSICWTGVAYEKDSEAWCHPQK